MTAALRLALCLVACLSAGCSRHGLPELGIDVGSNANESFAPAAAFAERMKLPTMRDELRLTLASCAASCDKFVSHGPEDVPITATGGT